MNAGRETSTKFTFLHDVRMLFDALRRGKMLIAFCTLTCASVGAYYAFSSPKIYSARAVIQVEQEEQKLMNIEGMKAEDLKALEIIKTFEQSITAPEVLLRVIRHEKLNADPDFLPEISPNASETLLQETLAKHIDAKIRRGTRLIDITVEHRDPKMAQRIAEGVLKEFAGWNFEMEREAGQLANNFLVKEAERLKGRLAKSEQSLQTYKEENRGVSLEDKQSITLENLKSLNARVTLARAERIKLEADCSELTGTENRNPTAMQISGVISTTPAIVELKKTIAEREAHFATIEERYKAQHPKYIEARTELETLRNALERAVKDARGNLVSSYQAAVLTEQKLQDALREQETHALELNKILMPYAAFVRDLESDRAIFESVLTRLKQTDVIKDISQGAIRVVARPMLPERPVRPRKGFILVLASLAGLSLGSCAALVSYAADSSLRTVENAEALLEIPVLGEIPNTKPSKRLTRRGLDPFASSPITLEAFHHLSIAIAFEQDKACRKTLIFASPSPGKGKTYCSVNCAVAFAQQGAKTLLVDADFSNPEISRLFLTDGKISAATPTSDTGKDSDFIFQKTHIDNLSVMALFADDTTSRKSLNYRNLRQLLTVAEEKFDRVVIDSSPLQRTNDAVSLCDLGGVICLVVCARTSPSEDTIRAVSRLRGTNALIAGFVWNRSNLHKDNRYRSPWPIRTRTIENRLPEKRVSIPVAPAKKTGRI
ncbi:MAG: Capsular exopolysaccharide family [Chthoniobacteraceae bacterium]|nr:Capsular exopolysaccharide family [Chthoniobacteraceae bacterium]